MGHFCNKPGTFVTKGGTFLTKGGTFVTMDLSSFLKVIKFSCSGIIQLFLSVLVFYFFKEINLFLVYIFFINKHSIYFVGRIPEGRNYSKIKSISEARRL